MTGWLCLLLLPLLLTAVAVPFRNRGVVPGSPLVMHWTFLNQEQLRIDIEWNHNSFAPIILARNMVGTDLWLCSKESVTESYEITDRWAYDHAPPILDTDSSHDGLGTDDLTDKSVEEDENRIVCSFTRKLNTGDHKDKLLVRGQTYQLCSFVSTTPNLHMHNRDLSNIFCWYWQMVDHFDGQFRQVPKSVELPMSHGIIMTVLWGLVIDISLMLVRYMKTTSSYTNIHAVLMVLINGGTITMALLMLFNRSTMVFYNFSAMSTAAKIHFLLGSSLLLSIIIQHIGGVIIKYLKESPRLEAQRFLKKVWIHRLGGYLVYGIGKVQLLLGWWVFKGGFSYILAILLSWYLLLILCRLLAEYSYRNGRWMFSRLMVKLGSITHLEQEKVSGNLSQKNELLSGISEPADSLVQLIRNGHSREYIRQNHPNYRYVFFKHFICDLSDFNHPGGASVIESVIGEEISKYLYGGATIEDNPTQLHIHSRYAIRHLESRTISRQDDTVCEIFEQDWQLQHITELSPNLFKITFHNQDFTIKTNPKQPASYLGKYFLLTTEGTTRPYTLLLSQLDYNVAYRTRLLEYYKRKFSGSFDMERQTSSHEISFIIKRYPTGNVSRSVHFGVNTIEGLFGLGLQLEPGTNVIITGGTGILPFLDLFDLLLKKAIFMAALRQSSGNTTQFPTDMMNIFNIDYPSLLPNIKIRLFASFNCSDEFRSYNWLLDLHLISKKLGLELFEFNLRIPKQSQQLEPGRSFFSHIDKEFCQRNFQSGSFNKVYCCGPPDMNTSILGVFQQLHYPRSLYRIM